MNSGFNDYDFEDINNKDNTEKNFTNRPNSQSNQNESELEKMNLEEKIQNNGENDENNNNKNPFNNYKPQEEKKEINLLKKLSGEENNDSEINNKNSIKVKKSKEDLKIKQIKIIKTKNNEEDNNKSLENKAQIMNNENMNLNEEQKENNKEKVDLKALISNKTYETQIIGKYIKDDSTIKMIRLGDLKDRSYLSSVLRCFVSFKQLSLFFLDENNGKKMTDSLNRCQGSQQRLSYAIHKLFAHIYKKVDSINGTYEPESIYKVLCEKNFLFKTGTEMNPINCFREILTRLHDELNAPDFTYVNLNQNNGNDVIEKGINDYLSENKSIISENFSLYELEEVRCPCCGTRKNRFKSFFTFDLDIENINIQEKNKIKLYDCLDRLFNTNKKKVYCDSNKCHDFTEADCTKSIIKTPTIFAFLIDRKNFDKNLMDINFVIDEKINLRPYMYYSCNNVDYQLKAIVSIFIIENKYINFVKIENIWYAFDDKKIQKVEYDDIFNTHRESSIQHIPCILIYELINNNNDNNNKN